jgi:hypothetical protein
VSQAALSQRALPGLVALSLLALAVPPVAHAADVYTLLTLKVGSSGDYPDEVCLVFNENPIKEDSLSQLETRKEKEELRCEPNTAARSESKSGALFVQILPAPNSKRERPFVAFFANQLHIRGYWPKEPGWMISVSRYYRYSAGAVRRRDAVLGSFAELTLIPKRIKRTFLLPELDADAGGGSARATYKMGVVLPSGLPLLTLAFALAIPVDLDRAGGLASTTEEVPSEVKSFDISVKQGEVEIASYVADVADAASTAPIPVRARLIRFTWMPSKQACQPDGDCPEAVILDSGITCDREGDKDKDKERDGPRGRECRYVCKHQGNPPATFAVPADVRMSIGRQQDTWVERIVRPRQVVSGSPSRDTRQFAVYFPWQVRGPHVEGPPAFQKLVHVDLFAPDGRAFRIDVDNDGTWKQNGDSGNKALTLFPLSYFVHLSLFLTRPVRVTVPGMTCGDALTYRYWGDFQNFRPSFVTLEDGGYRLGRPKNTYRNWWLGLRISVAFLFTAAGGPPHNREHQRPGADIEGSVQYRFFDRRYVLEGWGAYLIGQRDYVPIGASAATRDTHVLLANRVSLGGRFLGAPSPWWPERWWFGVGAGAQSEWAVAARTEPLLGTVAWAGFLEAIGRFLPHRWVNLQFSARFIFPDWLRSFQAAKEASSTFGTDRRFGVMLLFGVGANGAP